MWGKKSIFWGFIGQLLHSGGPWGAPVWPGGRRLCLFVGGSWNDLEYGSLFLYNEGTLIKILSLFWAPKLEFMINSSLGPRPPGGPKSWPTLKPMPDSDSGRKIVQETCVVFNGSISEVFTNLMQTWPKNDQFMAGYASRQMWPIWRTGTSILKTP